MIGNIMRGLRDIMVMTERVAVATELAKQADCQPIKLGERLARVEALLDYALGGSASRPPAPPALPGPSEA